jgi:hypothetical protein
MLHKHNKTRKTATPESHVFKQLFSSSSDEFIQELTKYSSKLGVSLRKTGMYRNNKRIKTNCKTEQDFFKMLHLKYVPINNRKTKQDIKTSLPIFKDSKAVKRNRNPTCYTSCNAVPIGLCATGCNPSWETSELINSRNWCHCNLNNDSCGVSICSNKTKKNKDKNKTKKNKDTGGISICSK